MNKYFLFVLICFASASCANDGKLKKPFRLTYSRHALQRLQERNVSKQAAEDTVRRGFKIIDRYGNLAFVLHENNTTIRVVTAFNRPHVITVMRWKTAF